MRKPQCQRTNSPKPPVTYWGGGAILVKDRGGDFSRLYVLADRAGELQRALDQDCYPGLKTQVPSEPVRYWHPETGDEMRFVSFDILPEHAAMIANGVERTQKGERRGIANTMVVESSGSPEADIEANLAAFTRLANGESLSGLAGRNASGDRNSGFGGITGK